jgi:glycosyltransferase involved in cell wall biosynthesis
MKKLCSVCISVFNRSELIIQTLDSVLNQTYRPIELIICDDASTDNSYDIISTWKKNHQSKDFNIILIKNIINKGAPYSRNRVIELSSGDYCQFLDSDDLLYYNKLSIQVQALEDNPSAQAAWNPLIRFSSSVPILENPNFDYTINTNYKNPFKYEFLPSASLHRTLLLKKTGFWNEKLKRWQDLEYQLRLVSNIQTLLVFDCHFYFFRQHNLGRINDQYYSTDGIINGLTALSYVEIIINKKFVLNSEIKQEVFNFYLSIFFLILKSKDYDSERKILKKLLQWSPNIIKCVKSISLLLLLILTPRKFVKYILKKYL